MSEIKNEIKQNSDGTYTITDKHSTADIVRWLVTQDSKETILYLLAELESQEPDKYEMDIECTKCGAKQSGVLTVHTHPPQRTWVGSGDLEDSNAYLNTEEKNNG
jgi:hypothetical protein